MSLWNIYMSRILHVPAILIMGALYLLFFLYMVRTEVRERLR